MIWGNQILSRLAAGCLAGVLLLGCGESGEPTDPSATKARSRAGESGQESGDNGFDAGPGDAATVSTPVRAEIELEFRIALDRSEFELGEEIPARLSLRNVTDRPIRIYDPAKCLPADLTFKIETPDRRTLRIKEHREIREQSLTEGDFVVIPPHGTVTAEMDLEPTIRSAGQGLVGGYRIRTTFTGGYQGRSLTMDVWNRGGSKSLDAPLVLLTLRWPSRLTKLGITPEIDARVTKLLTQVGRSGRPPQVARRELNDLGELLLPILVQKLSAAAARKPREQIIGWSAFYLLRDSGDRALTALANAPEIAKSPIGSMLAHLIDSDLRRDAARMPTSKDVNFLHLLLDADPRPGTIFRVSRTGNPKVPGDVFTIRDDGSLRYERKTGPETTVVTGNLGEKGLKRLFRTLADERIWLIRAARNSGAAGESRLLLELLKQSDGVDGPEISLWRLDVWETEALQFNRSLLAVLTALGEAKLALRR